ncbi:NUDIX hydrolase [candidate division WWE3 bacterium]|jgi:ADP-ribose pyrophosphatase|nr:NUDIX hydrolase [candidate division WWE3 bacterium]
MKVTKREVVTKRPFLNLMEATYNNEGNEGKWTYVSRSTKKTGQSDAVMVVGITKNNQVVLIKQYRVPADDYIIEFPAGLIDEGETAEEAAKREFKEETGMEITKILKVSPSTYNSAGLTDETVTMVFAEVEGEPSNEGNESTEDIEILVLDRTQLHELEQDSNTKWSAKGWLYCGILF